MRARRIQAAIDSGAALTLAMLAWPFPLARAMLPLPVNIAAVLVFWQLVQVVYFAVTLAIWGRTGGMRLQGLALRTANGEEAERAVRIRWGLVAGALALGQIVSPTKPGGSALAERVANVVLVAEQRRETHPGA